MNTNPETMTSLEVDPSGRYRCPLCKVQTTADKEDIGWISCPMVDSKIICFGCCFDYQIITRSDDFNAHPARKEFDFLASKTCKDVPLLRRICLQHQESLHIAELQRSEHPHIKRAMSDLLTIIRLRLKSLDEE